MEETEEWTGGRANLRSEPGLEKGGDRKRKKTKTTKKENALKRDGKRSVNEHRRRLWLKFWRTKNAAENGRAREGGRERGGRGGALQRKRVWQGREGSERKRGECVKRRVGKGAVRRGWGGCGEGQRPWRPGKAGKGEQKEREKRKERLERSSGTGDEETRGETMMNGAETRANTHDGRKNDAGRKKGRKREEIREKKRKGNSRPSRMQDLEKPVIFSVGRKKGKKVGTRQPGSVGVDGQPRGKQRKRSGEQGTRGKGTGGVGSADASPTRRLR